MEKNFVVFMSPGTFGSEQSEKPIDSWDVKTAVSLSKSIKERYDALPYGFYFVTHGRGPNDLDSKKIKSSGMYYLGGKVETYEEIVARNDPKEEILRSNMRCNGYKRIVTNTNSWKWTQPLQDEDTVLDMKDYE